MLSLWEDKLIGSAQKYFNFEIVRALLWIINTEAPYEGMSSKRIISVIRIVYEKADWNQSK